MKKYEKHPTQTENLNNRHIFYFSVEAKTSEDGYKHVPYLVPLF